MPEKEMESMHTKRRTLDMQQMPAELELQNVSRCTGTSQLASQGGTPVNFAIEDCQIGVDDGDNDDDHAS
jgi:hypothetical protein